MQMLGEKKVFEILQKNKFEIPQSIVDVLLAHTSKWSPEEQSLITKIDAEKINALFSDFIFMGAIKCVHIQNEQLKKTVKGGKKNG